MKAGKSRLAQGVTVGSTKKFIGLGFAIAVGATCLADYAHAFTQVCGSTRNTYFYYKNDPGKRGCYSCTGTVGKNSVLSCNSGTIKSVDSANCAKCSQMAEDALSDAKSLNQSAATALSKTKAVVPATAQTGTPNQSNTTANANVTNPNGSVASGNPYMDFVAPKDKDGNQVVSSGSRGTMPTTEKLGQVTIPAGTKVGAYTVNGSRVLVLNEPLTTDGKTLPNGTYLDASGNVVHTSVEYTSSDKQRVYHTREGAEDAKLLEDPNTVVAKYDREGNPIGEPKTVREIDEKIKAERTAEREKGGKPKFDDCKRSYEYALKYDAANADKYKCSTTNGIAKGTEIANQVLTGTGRSLVYQMGANAAQAARNGTLIGDQKAAAQMAKTSSTYETALTLANTAAAYILGKKANQHKQNLANLNDAQAYAKERTDAGLGDVDAATRARALDEQSNARNIASLAAFKATMTAVQGAAGMMASKSAQKAAEENARLAQQAQDKINANSFKYDPNQLAPPVSNEFDPRQMAATGATTDTTGATTSSDGLTATNPDDLKVADGSDSGAGGDSIQAPAPGAFKSGVAGGAGGGAAGGGAPSAGGGGGSGGPTATDDPKASYASEFGTKERYETSGGLTGAGGAKGGIGGKGGDGAGVDLNGLLAQFLPKAEDESAHRSILDTVAFGGNRNIANEEAPSYLDKNADLFQRIHETMSEKNRRGQLGI